MEPLERTILRPRQVGYQAALRPNVKGFGIKQVASHGEFREDGERICPTQPGREVATALPLTARTIVEGQERGRGG
jgi:hypothetical protein